MTEFFTSITIEVKAYADTTWTDITSRVQNTPPPTGTSIGISDNGYLSRLGGSGVFTFEVDNSDGYFTTGAGTGLLGGNCRLLTKWDGVQKCKFNGYWIADAYKQIAGVYGRKTISVAYRTWLGWALAWPVDYLEYTTDKRIDEAVPLLLAGLPIQPMYTTYYTGDYTFPDMFDVTRSNTTVGGEFNKLAVSEIGYIYQRFGMDEGEELVVENKLKRNDDTGDTAIPVYSADHSGDALLLEDGTSYLLLEDGTSHLLLEENATVSFSDSDIQPGFMHTRNRHHVNYVTIKTRPRKHDADSTTILWTMESPTLVAAGGSVSGIRGNYRDPSGGASYVNGINMTTPIRNTDYQAFQNNDGTGSDFSEFCQVVANFKKSTSYVDITVYNTGVNDFYIGGPDITFQVRGQGVYIYDATDVNYENTGSNSYYPYAGRRTITWDMYYQSDATNIIALFNATWLKNTGGVTVEAYTLLANKDTKNMRAWQYLDVGSRATFAETQSQYNQSAYINGYSFKIIDKEYIFWAPILFDEARAPNF